MNTAIRLSFFDSILPGMQTKERKKINTTTMLPKGESPKNREVFEKNIQLANLLLRITKSASDAILNSQYTKFDALIKNFGCQMTALDVQQKMLDPKVQQEALKIETIVLEKLGMLKQMSNQNALGGLNFSELFIRLGMDFEISSDMLDLIRFRILNVINDNKLVQNREIPFTNFEKLFEIIPEIKDKTLLRTLINGIQIEESAKASSFISRTASKLDPSSSPRIRLIQRALKESFECQSAGIFSLPLLYNTEASLRAARGIFLVKNKLFLCGKRIADAEPVKAFFKMPNEELLTEDEIKLLPQEEPIIVIEGYIKEPIDLVKKIQTLGLLNIVNANCASLPQYVKSNNKEFDNDEEFQADLSFYKEMKNEAISIIEIDHVFCSSIKEER